MPHGGHRRGAGRPKGALNKMTQQAREIAARHLESLIAEQARLALGAESEAVRNNAIERLLNRTIGRAAPACPENSVKHPVRVSFEWDPSKAELIVPVVRRPKVKEEK